MQDNQVSKEQFSQMVRKFLLVSPKHEKIFRKKWGMAHSTLYRWVKGASTPHWSLVRRSVKFIEEHLRSCICKKSKKE